MAKHRRHAKRRSSRRCGDGYGKTPTAAFRDALKNLAKIKR